MTSTPPIVLALDQSTRATGWAIGSTDGRAPLHGVFKLPPWQDEEGAMLVRYRKWLAGIIKSELVTHVYYERPLFRPTDRVDTHAKLFMVLGIINMVAVDLSCSVAQVEINAWRKRFLGTTKPLPGLKGVFGEQSLKDIAIRVCAKRGWLVSDHNEAEALGILDFALCSLDKHYAGATDGIFRRAELTADTAAVRARAGGR